MTQAAKIGYLPREGADHLSPEEICRGLSQIGFKGVEWSRYHFKPREMTTAALKKLVTIPADFGMEVSEIFIALDYVVTDEARRKDNIELTKECVAAAAEIGVNVVNVSTGPQRWMPNHVKIPQEMSEGTAWEMVFEAFDQIIQVAEQKQVYLAVEGVWGMISHDYYTTLPLFDRFKSEYLAINMDPSHGSLCRNDVGWAVRQWNKRIKHVHLKDSIGKSGYDGDDFIFCLLGEGQVDWNAFFSAMRDIGYDGIYSIEFESFKYYRQILSNDMFAAAKLSWDCVQKLLGR